MGGLYNTNPHHASEFPLRPSPLQTEHSQVLLMRTQTAEVPTSHPLLFKHSPSCSNTSLLNTLSERALGLQQTRQRASAPTIQRLLPTAPTCTGIRGLLALNIVSHSTRDEHHRTSLEVSCYCSQTLLMMLKHSKDMGQGKNTEAQ